MSKPQSIREQMEFAIWGYNDPEGWPAGSFGDELLNKAVKCYNESGVDSIDVIAAFFKPTVDGIHGNIKTFLFGDEVNDGKEDFQSTN